jgi:hypothetical protein
MRSCVCIIEVERLPIPVSASGRQALQGAPVLVGPLLLGARLAARQDSAAPTSGALLHGQFARPLTLGWLRRELSWLEYERAH